MRRRRITAAAGAVLALAATGLVTSTGTASAYPPGRTFMNSASRLCMVPDAASSQPGARIIQWPCDGTQPLQYWFTDLDKYGHSRLRNAASGLCVDIQGADGAAGTPLIQWTCNDQWNQVWNGPGTYGVYTNNESPAMAINDPNSSTAWGVQLIAWPVDWKNNPPNQQWR